MSTPSASEILKVKNNLLHLIDFNSNIRTDGINKISNAFSLLSLTDDSDLGL
uniref:Uncharacterized protein n=1 Tax=viral metagenome TaxID=1070528 RepID=A0A6C0KHJ2_9ZZZZ